MSFQIRPLRKKDYWSAIRASISGMHFDWYMNRPLQLLYGYYFWAMELNRATQILVAEENGTFAGVLLARFDGEPPAHRSRGEQAYVRFAQWIQKIFTEDSSGYYYETVDALTKEYLGRANPDGEILFLAADPKRKGSGVGTRLLQALAEREPDKTVFLNTDSACTYQFYDRRGFRKEEEKEIILKLPKRNLPITIMVYSQKLRNLL